jgi:phosphoribosylaminoimidazole-succinocarboxamide synthase
VAGFCRTAAREGFAAIIAGAGMSNALSGTAAAHSLLPVYGVPLSSDSAVHDSAALLSTVDMPPGIPVGTMALDGSANAGLMAVRQLAWEEQRRDPRSPLARKLRGFMDRGANVRAPMPTHSGKVRDTFEYPSQPGCLIQWASDRISAFDWVLDDPIPGKGEVLTDLTRFWLTQVLVDIMPNHLVADHQAEELPGWAVPLAGQIAVVKKLEMINLECIVRGYLAGSAWREYRSRGTVHGQRLPVGMVECQELPEPIFTPSTKAAEGQFDENIDIKQAEAIVGAQFPGRGRELVEAMSDASLRLYKQAKIYAEARGVLILDTKFEFGLDPETGALTLADEVFTPDSSRFVDAETFVLGEAPESMDKEYVRQAILATGWMPKSSTPPLPLGLHVIHVASHRYRVIAERLMSGRAA